MCLAVPMRITEMLGNGRAKAEVGGVVRDVDLSLIDGAEIGDYIIAHVGFALSKLDPEWAKETLALFAEAGALELQAEEELAR